jgi:hypothetical protein
MLMFSGYITVQGLATKVLEDNNFGKLGFYCMGLQFFAFGWFSLISSAVVNKLGERMSLFLGSCSLLLNVLCYILPTLRSENPDNETLRDMYWFIYVLIMAANVFTGFG